MEKPITDWTRSEFDALPDRKWDEDIGPFNALVILPLKKNHESGYRLMDFVAVRKGVPVCRLSGCSDVLHIDAIGGRCHNQNSAWQIDCLPKSGLLLIYPRAEMTCGSALSSFEITAVPPLAPPIHQLL